MDFYKKLNLNKIKFLERKTRLITLLRILFLFAAYIRTPHIRTFNAKDICGKWWMGQLNKDVAYKKLSLKKKGDLLEYCVHFR